MRNSYMPVGGNLERRREKRGRQNPGSWKAKYQRYPHTLRGKQKVAKETNKNGGPNQSHIEGSNKQQRKDYKKRRKTNRNSLPM